MRLQFLIVLILLAQCAYALECRTNLVGVTEVRGGYAGILANLTVYALPGSGHVFVQTMPLTEIDTQASARLAKEVSCELLNSNCSGLDFFYIVEGDYPMIGGPSAGAAMTACTLSVLLNKTLYNDVAITGTINPDGSIGPVGSVLEKASVLAGYNKFLIPADSANQLALINGTMVKVDIPSYAQSNLGLNVLTVTDIIEAFKHLSGYEIIFENVSSSEVASDEYSIVMRMMAGSLINKSLNFNLTDYPTKLNELVAEGSSLLNDARSYYDNGSYYNSASYAVRSLIINYYVYNIINYNNITSAELLINETYNDILSFEESLKSFKVDHIYDLESYAITIDRLNEAKDLISSTYNKQLTEALYYNSFAQARLLTAEEWFSLTKFFSSNETTDFNSELLKPLIIQRLEQARNSLTYAKTLTTDNLLNSAEQHLSIAYEAYNEGEYVYSLFEALKSRAEANLAMGVRGVINLSAKIDSKKEAALRAINRAEQRGLLPFLSLSYVEYADTFRDEDPNQALAFLSYAVEFAGVSGLINDQLNIKSLTPASSYFIIRSPDDYVSLNHILFLIMGFIAGLLITLIRYESD